MSDSWKKYYSDALDISDACISTLHNPVSLPDAESLRSRKKSEVFHIVSVGRIGERKGSFLLIKALEKLVKVDRASVCLTLAGDGKVQQAEKLAKSLGISHSISMPGWLHGGDIQELLSTADVFVLPSFNEGLPMAILEAMSWKVPVIASCVGGIPEVIVPGRTGLLLESIDAESIRQAIQQLINDDNLRSNLGAAGRDHICEFGLDKYRNKLISIYRNVLNVSGNGFTQRVTGV